MTHRWQVVSALLSITTELALKARSCRDVFENTLDASQLQERTTYITRRKILFHPVFTSNRLPYSVSDGPHSSDGIDDVAPNRFAYWATT